MSLLKRPRLRPDREHRLASHRNPFNYYYTRYGPWQESPTVAQKKDELFQQSQTVAGLRYELRRRGLPSDGTKADLVDRIKTHNLHVISPEGVREKYDRGLAIVKEAAMEAIAPFPQFSLLPVEVRLMIWEYSLPGPRVLTVSCCRDPPKIHFREDDNLPNPGMLSACSESRSVALKRFKLCPGTSNVYADFSGGDILYFGRHWDEPYRVFRRLWDPDDYHELLRDVRHISRVALHYHFWRRFSKPENWNRNGHYLRSETERNFPNLKELFLINSGPDSDLGSEFAKTPGHIVFEDKLGPYIGNPPTIWDWMKPGFVYRVRETYMMLDKELDKRDRGLPEVKVVAEKRIPNIPGDDWGRDGGEPFVSTSYLPTKTLDVVTNPTKVSVSQTYD
jgi:hypothetical protein